MPWDVLNNTHCVFKSCRKKFSGHLIYDAFMKPKHFMCGVSGAFFADLEIKIKHNKVYSRHINYICKVRTRSKKFT